MKHTLTLPAHLLPPQVDPPVALVERWEKRLGESVLAGEPVVTIRAAGEMIVVPADCFGILSKRCVLPGETVEAGEPVAVFSGVRESLASTAAASRPPAAPAYIPGGPEEIVPRSDFDRARSRYAERSWIEAPHVHTVALADAGLALRYIEKAARGETVSGTPVALTLLPFILSAVASSLVAHPALNAQLVGDQEIRRKRYVHIGVESPDAHGTPAVLVLRDANRKSVLALARESEQLRSRLLAGAATPEDVTGATFLLSEAAGMLYRTPLLQRPLAAHLCFGKPVGGQIHLCLAHDARVVTSAAAEAFLTDVTAGLSEARFLFAV